MFQLLLIISFVGPRAIVESMCQHLVCDIEKRFDWALVHGWGWSVKQSIIIIISIVKYPSLVSQQDSREQQ